MNIILDTNTPTPLPIAMAEAITVTIKHHSRFGDLAKRWWQSMVNSEQWQEHHAKMIRSLLERHVLPLIGNRMMNDLTINDYRSVTENTLRTNSIGVVLRVKSIISNIQDYGICSGERIQYSHISSLNKLYIKPPVRHRRAITDKNEAAKFIAAIGDYCQRPNRSIQGAALIQLQILTMLRPRELRECQWQFVDWDNARLVIPSDFMKGRIGNGRADHIVPLSRQALEIFKSLRTLHNRKFIFTNQRDHTRPPSTGALVNNVLKSIGYGPDIITPHGFRAMARTLLDEELGYRPEWIETQLHHLLTTPNGTAYDRAAFISDRTKMMQHWNDFLNEIADQYRRDSL